MSHEVYVLLGTAAALGFVHTILGPDHYLPFIALAKARSWSMRKTLWITTVCGIGHVLGSVVLGMIGVAAGITLRRLNLIESVRGDIAAWLLIAFGLVYTAWGIRSAVRNKPHHHAHDHTDGTRHAHSHAHTLEHAHPHDNAQHNLAPWVLFIVFVLGPCEPLIPLLMFPAASESAAAVALVAAVFGAVTVATMATVVLLSSYGLSFVRQERLGRYAHALAGAFILLCGVAIRFGL